MMEHTLLIERILAKCYKQKWYGGDLSNTARYSDHGMRYDTYYTAEGKRITIDHNPDDHPRKTSFAYAPASEEQLLATEEALGFPLPPLLRTLYAQIANGGFGPGYGLHGALGGFDEAGNLVDGYTFHRTRSELIDLEAYASASSIDASIDLPDTVWPRYFLYLCDWGCATTSCLDAVTGRVYVRYPSHTEIHAFTLRLEAPSLDAWLELWLTDRLEDKGSYTNVRAYIDADEGEADGKLPPIEVVPFYTSEDPPD
jgi:hypothetical protein